ncbi:MAG: c-type cytochrome, partial [Steroidobacteraceae bacterium]
QSRADPDAQAYMWGMASQLNDAMISGLANYFAAQPAPVGTSGNAALIVQGKKLYEEGVPARQIPPCASCHGPRAQGMATFPRLAGQHAPYLLKQLLVIQSVLRMAPVMHGVVKDLNRDQMQELVAYLESI